jgi:hypothetical protein
VSFLFGCSQQTAEEKYLNHWEKIVTILLDNKNDSAKATTAVKEYISANIAEMKQLAGQFGKEEGKKIVQDSNFIMRVKKIRESILDLEQKHPQLLGDAAVSEALSQLGDITY